MSLRLCDPVEPPPARRRSAAELDAELMQAHASGDRAYLAELYELAADASDEPDAAAFFLTHAYIFALDAGSSRRAALHRRLVDLGCER